MRYSKVHIDAVGYALPPVVVRSHELERRLQPVYKALHIQDAQLEHLTGIAERRWWHPRTPLSQGATTAAERALAQSGVQPGDVEVLIYGGVCREAFEPATACRVADALGISRSATIYDISNACLGVLNGMIDVANRIELGHIRAGLVVSCESAREIVDIISSRLLDNPSMELYKESLATFTGGSGAAAVLLTDGSYKSPRRHRLLGGVSRAAPEHHALCRWGLDPDLPATANQVMTTDAVAVLKHGVDLGYETWQAFLKEMGWTQTQVDRIICHQVGSANQEAILERLQIPAEKDFTTYEFLGNVGTVSLPLTLALAEERGVVVAGDRIGLLGIGSGLNCLMLGVEW